MYCIYITIFFIFEFLFAKICSWYSLILNTHIGSFRLTFNDNNYNCDYASIDWKLNYEYKKTFYNDTFFIEPFFINIDGFNAKKLQFSKKSIL